MTGPLLHARRSFIVQPTDAACPYKHHEQYDVLRGSGEQEERLKDTELVCLTSLDMKG